jgi:hypothetical protein
MIRNEAEYLIASADALPLFYVIPGLIPIGSV